MDEYCRENGFASWFETSARDNINIDEAARALVEKVRFVINLLNKFYNGRPNYIQYITYLLTILLSLICI